MWNLNHARQRVNDRLAEDSTVFWSSEIRDEYINDAQRFIAAATMGVEEQVNGVVAEGTPFLTLPDRVLNAHPAQAYCHDGRMLSVVPMATATSVDPNWRSRIAAYPLWAIPHFSDKIVYFSPRPRDPVNVTISVSVLPDPVEAGSDLLFNGEEIMERYLNVFVNLAVSFALLKERYDGDSERYYQLAVAELGALGVNIEDIPSFKRVREETRERE